MGAWLPGWELTPQVSLQLWMWLWKACLVLTLAGFATMSVIVTVGSIGDIRRMMARLGDEQRPSQGPTAD